MPAEETERHQGRGPGARALTGRAVAAVLAPSPTAMRRFALAGVISTAVIIATGAAVRLSESGLGCPDWPQCTRSSLVAAHSAGDPMFHTWIEFGNRLVTVAITLIAVLVFVAAWQFRPGGHRRRDLVWLAAAQPAGILAQALLGGIVVLTKLNPAMVALHFLASIAVLAAAVALHVRCTEGQEPARSLVRADLRLLGYGVVAAVAVMLAAGTVVTGTGPLARAMTAYQVAATELALAHERVGRGGSTPGEFEERRRALTGVMAASHKLIWQHSPGAARPAGAHRAP